MPPPKPKAPAALITALFLLLAPTALAGERTEAAPRVAQAQPALTAPAAQPAPTALAEEQPQPAPTIPADQQPQPLPRVAQAQPAPPTGDGFATKNDIRWESKQNELRWSENDRRWSENDRRWDQNERRWEQNERMLTAIRDEIRANRAENERRWLQVLDQINALYIVMITGLVAIVAALLGIIALLIPRRNAPAAAPKTALPRPTSA